MTELPASEERLSSPRILVLSPVEQRVATWAILLSLVARWQALLPAYSIDDYEFLNPDKAHLAAAPGLASGRELSVLTLDLLTRLGASPPRASVIGVVALTVVLVLVGIACCRLWGINGRFAESTIVTCLIALHPYQAEIFTFRTAVIFLAIPLLLSFLSLLAVGGSKRQWWLATGLLTCSLSFYQLVLNYLALALLFCVAFHIVRKKEDRAPGFWRTLGARCAMIVTSVMAYSVLTLILGKLLHAPLGSRAALIGTQDIIPRTLEAIGLMSRIFLRGEAVFPVAAKALLLLSLLACVVVYFVGTTRGGVRLWPEGLLALAIPLVIGVPLCVGLILVLGNWWPVPRVLEHAGVFWAGIFALALWFAPPAGRRLLTISAALILTCFVGINNQIFNDQIRLNMRDFAKTNRIIERVESLPDFDHVKGIVLSGGFWGYSSPIPTAEGDMNISSLYAAWSKLPLLNEVSGYSFVPAPPDIVQKADAYCKTARKWPAPESVTEIESFAVVCQVSD